MAIVIRQRRLLQNVPTYTLRTAATGGGEAGGKRRGRAVEAERAMQKQHRGPTGEMYQIKRQKCLGHTTRNPRYTFSGKERDENACSLAHGVHGYSQRLAWDAAAVSLFLSPADGAVLCVPSVSYFGGR